MNRVTIGVYTLLAAVLLIALLTWGTNNTDQQWNTYSDDRLPVTLDYPPGSLLENESFRSAGDEKDIFKISFLSDRDEFFGVANFPAGFEDVIPTEIPDKEYTITDDLKLVRTVYRLNNYPESYFVVALSFPRESSDSFYFVAGPFHEERLSVFDQIVSTIKEN